MKIMLSNVSKVNNLVTLEKHLGKSIGVGKGLSWKETSYNQVKLPAMYELYKKYNNHQ